MAAGLHPQIAVPAVIQFFLTNPSAPSSITMFHLGTEHPFVFIKEENTYAEYFAPDEVLWGQKGSG